MKKRFNWSDGIAFLIWLTPLIYLAVIYPSLGNRLPLHFDATGNPDSYGTKTDFLGVIAIVSGVSLGSSMLVRYLPKIDPKKKARYSQPSFIRISHAILIIMAAVTSLIIYAAAKNHFALHSSEILPIIGLFFAYMGNQMNSIKPNYFVGIRTPWTLENEEVWRKTHKMAAKLWLVGGVTLAVATLFLKEPASHIVFITGAILLGLVPVVYSYICFKNLPHKSI